MLDKPIIEKSHPLRQLFRNALTFALEQNPTDNIEVTEYLEEQVLCEFARMDNLFSIRDEDDRPVEDMADMLQEGTILLKAQSFEREFAVHKHIGDYTLFMLGMFPSAIARKRGKEFLLGALAVPCGNLCDHYMLQGQRSYRIAAEFTNGDLFMELASNFMTYRNILECVRLYFQEGATIH